jgi:hypothetical protein
MTKRKPLIKKRPAETGTVGLGIPVSVVQFFALEGTARFWALAPLAVSVAPAVFTYLKIQGGLRGVLRSLWG